MQARNLLFILSDQHNRNITGCYGHPQIQTPHLDRLAERGTLFANAYTNCPICVPARASLATGQYVHQIGNWDNAFPYDGSVPSWGHRLRALGHRVDSIGKLHFGTQKQDHGFSKAIEPLHVVDGVGDLLGAIRDDPPFRNKRPGIVEAGPGDSSYLRYDARNADNTCTWLQENGGADKPWVLFASFVCPHPPYISPQELFGLYPLEDIQLPPQWRADEWPHHPAIDYFRRFFGLTEQFDEVTVRRLNAAYYGVCTYLDQQIGRVLTTLAELGLEDSTRIIYTSDHGESLGARGLFGKFTMYEESAAVPLIVAGPDVPSGKTVRTPVSLVDCFPTIIEGVGQTLDEEDQALPGESLWNIAAAGDRDRTVLSEYHAVGTRHAVYMLRDAQYKYVHYVNDPPQLFDLEADPNEVHDLATEPSYADVRNEFEARLSAILDPDTVDARAKQDQAAKVAAFGGVETVLARGTFDNSPTPDEAPAFRKFGHSG